MRWWYLKFIEIVRKNLGLKRLRRTIVFKESFKRKLKNGKFYFHNLKITPYPLVVVLICYFR